jgi:hypothetical protein
MLVVLVCGGWAFERHTRSGNEQALSAVASELAGRPVHVRCESFWHSIVNVDGNLGDVPFPNGRAAAYTHVTRGMCKELARFRSRPEAPELACLAEFDWNGFTGSGDPLSLQPFMPTDYQSGECAAGRWLDLHPETGVFPTESVPGPPPAGFYGPQL